MFLFSFGSKEVQFLSIAHRIEQLILLGRPLSLQRGLSLFHSLSNGDHPVHPLEMGLRQIDRASLLHLEKVAVGIPVGLEIERRNAVACLSQRLRKFRQFQPSDAFELQGIGMKNRKIHCMFFARVSTSSMERENPTGCWISCRRNPVMSS
ncbi:MAG: hypothetical protein K0S45_3806 [Nitrospira sp.]|nr:hypothetical protein [Nitrospira sp.]